ncbi:MAG TPA: LON peptidase substrate-binding domain-containing protein, partial [Longimicrobiaceae bacterium]
MAPLKPSRQPLPDRIPVLPIRSTIVFPGGATALQIGYAPNVEALTRHPEHDLVVAMVSTLDDGDPLDPRELEKIATAVRVLDRLNLPGGTIQTTLQGLRRIRLSDVRLEDGYYSATPHEVQEIPAPQEEADPLVEKIVATITAVASAVERIPDEVPRILRMNLGDAGRFADLAATLSNLKLPTRDAVLQEVHVLARLKLVLTALEEEWEHVREVEQATGEEGGGPLPAGGRERRDEIRRRIQALQAELGEVDPVEREANEALRLVERAQLPPRVAAVARREAERLRSNSTTAAEAQEIRTYLDTLIAIPWTRKADGGKFDLEAVRAAIEDEHLGLEEPKRRLLEV